MSTYSDRDKMQFIGGAAATMALILFGSWIAVTAQPRWENKSQGQLVDFEARVELGAYTADVRALFDAQDYSHLNWDSSFSPYHVVRTVPKAGAYNWVLWLEERQGRIVSIRTREWKHHNIRPGESSPDRAVAEATQWPKGMDYAKRYWR